MPAKAKAKSKQSTRKPRVNVTLATFDARHDRPVYRRLRQGALASFDRVTDVEYRPYGMTPLRDAVSDFIEDLDSVRDPKAVTVGLLMDESGSMSENGKAPAVIQGVNEFVEGLAAEKDVDPAAAGKVLAVITTDGFENYSRRVSTEQLASMIAEREVSGWTFIFLGANQDAWATGTSYGLSGSASGQTVSTSDTALGTVSAFREAGARGVGYLGDHGTFMRTYSGQSANTVLSDDGEVTVNQSQSQSQAPEPKKVEAYGDVADALERAAEATRSPGAS